MGQDQESHGPTKRKDAEHPSGLMKKVVIIRNKDGKLRINKKTRNYIFHDGLVYFSLDKDQMIQLRAILDGVLSKLIT